MIYLDQAATSFPKPDAVFQAMDELARTGIGNPGRSAHWFSLKAEHVLDRFRRTAATLFGSSTPERIILTLNGTDSLNMAIKGTLRPGDDVITGNLEHNSVLRPLASLRDEGLISISTVSANAEGYYDVDDVERLITPQTKLVALCHASNVLGTIQPIADLGRLCRRRNVLLLVDAAQTAGSVPIDVEAMGIDLLATPGHKSLLGPMGTGLLCVGPRVDIRPWREGGTGGRSELVEHPREFPYVLEGGTPNVVGAAGLIAGMEHVLEQGLDAIVEHERGLLNRWLERTSCLDGFVEHPPTTGPRLPLVSLTSDSAGPEDVATILEQQAEIAVRSGLQCAPGAHRHLGTMPSGTVRWSAGLMNTVDDIDRLVDMLVEIGRELSVN